MKIRLVGAEFIHENIRADEQTGGRTDGRTNRRADEQTGGRTDGRTNRRADEQTGGRTDGRIGMTKLIVAFRNFANAPKKEIA